MGNGHLAPISLASLISPFNDHIGGVKCVLVGLRQS
jgi:hypothetical protein